MIHAGSFSRMVQDGGADDTCRVVFPHGEGCRTVLLHPVLVALNSIPKALGFRVLGFRVLGFRG